MKKNNESNVLSEAEGQKKKNNTRLSGVFFVYILRTNNNQLYIGHTNNLNRRELEHKHFHHGAKFIKDNGLKFGLVHTEKFSTRTVAMKREKQLKCWSRVKKEALIISDIDLLKRL